MTKPTLIYYSILQYQSDNYNLLNKQFDFVEFDSPSDDVEDILIQADVILAPLGYFFDKKKIDKCHNLKVIGSNTTGHPHIDVDYAKSKGISVVTLKHEHEFLDSITPTAELTWGLIIALTRNILPASQSVSDGKWNRRPFGGNKMLSRMTLGVVGLGRLGKHVSQYGLKFGMEVKYYDPYVSSEAPGLEKVSNLSELVSKSDVITVHVPHESFTENIFNKNIFNDFKNESYFVNTSRGELVDHDALLNVLKSGKLAGAALDVLDNEFLPNFNETISSNKLWQYAQANNNVIFTPHIGGSTKDAWYETERHTISLIQKALNSINQECDNDIKKSDVWAFIPARGGSKTIPLKNMALLNGKPLIEYAVTAGKLSKKISRIICSSDSDQIIDFCKQHGVDTQRRPDELSQDNTTTVDVILYTLQKLRSIGKKLPEFLVLLEPTSPFVESKHISDCIDILESDMTVDSAQTVAHVSSNSHAYNQRYHDHFGSHFLFEHERKTCINKQTKPTFFIHGNVRVMRVASLLRSGNIFGKHSVPVIIPRINAMDVDGPEDLVLAESVIKSGLV